MVSISKGSGKMEGICSVNTSPLSNGFCQLMSKKKTVCAQCYSQRMLKTSRKNCRPAFERNSSELSERVLDIRELPTINADICRLHSHGELINETHWKNFVKLAKKNANTLFVLWTKRLGLIQRKPKNMQIIYSNPGVDTPVDILPRNCVGVYNILSREGAKALKVAYNCQGKCRDCMKCYTKGTVGILYAELKENKNGTGRK